MIEVLYHEGPCWVVDKPSGVLTQAPPGIDSMEVRVRRFWQQLEGREGKLYVGVPHRLDRPVSGALIFARHVRATQRICQQLEKHTLTKRYLGLVPGKLPECQGWWTDHLFKVPGKALVQVVAADHADAKEAVLAFRVIRELDRYTLVEVRPLTGRTHQIRLQFAHRGFPIVGDSLYGSAVQFGVETEDPRERAIALHAWQLEFRHPTLPDQVHVTAPLPPSWVEYVPDVMEILRDRSP